MPVTVGGGVREVADIRRLLLAGADKVSINTAAVKRPEFVAEAADKFGNQCIVVAIDAKRVSGADEAPRWEIFTHGGRERTGIDAVEFARRVTALGAGELLLTSMDRDGTKARYAGPSGGRHPRGACDRSACGVDLPLRHLFDRRGEAPYGGGRPVYAPGRTLRR